MRTRVQSSHRVTTSVRAHLGGGCEEKYEDYTDNAITSVLMMTGEERGEERGEEG